MIVRGESTIIDYHPPFETGLKNQLIIYLALVVIVMYSYLWPTDFDIPTEIRYILGAYKSSKVCEICSSNCLKLRPVCLKLFKQL